MVTPGFVEKAGLQISVYNLKGRRTNSHRHKTNDRGLQKVKHCTHDEMVALCFEATYKVKNLQCGQPLGAIPAVTDILRKR